MAEMEFFDVKEKKKFKTEQFRVEERKGREGREGRKNSARRTRGVHPAPKIAVLLPPLW